MKKTILAAASTILLLAGCAQKSEMDKFVDDLLSKMTIEEKIGQLNLHAAAGFISALKVTEEDENVKMLRAGQLGGLYGTSDVSYLTDIQKVALESGHGIPLIFGLDVIHGHETVMPIPLAMSTSWNMQLIEDATRIAAKEASAQGINWVFSPMVDIARDARWGRIAEGGGEDPYLGGEIAKAYVYGYQGRDGEYSDNDVLACVKHYALYGAAEAGRDYNTVNLGRQEILNGYMNPYKAAAQAGAGSYMSSFNEFEGIPATMNSYLMDDLLRKSWGFDGFIVSDATAVMEEVAHGIGDLQEVSARSLKAGLDMDMNSDGFVGTLKKSLDEGKVSKADIDRACRRILEAKYKLGLFEDPFKYLKPERNSTDVYTKENRDFSRKVAQECQVLLKNDGVLPLKKNAKIAVVGPLANDGSSMAGTWTMSSHAAESVTILQGIKDAVTNPANVSYAEGSWLFLDKELEENVKYGMIKTFMPDVPTPPLHTVPLERLISEAVSKARAADVVVACVGEIPAMNGEGSSRADISIPDAEVELLKALKATGKPIVLVLTTGRPLTLVWEDENMNAILNTWSEGSEAGHAIADVLFGDVNPSAKLTTSFPRMVGQLPLYYNHKNTGRPHPDYAPYKKFTSCYIDVVNAPLYPFGYGLSYTTFEYGEPKLSASEMSLDGNVKVSVDVKNTGSMDGKEIVQLYIHDIYATSTRPVKELKGFQKVDIKAGETKTVEFTLTSEDLSYYNHDLQWVCESGDFEIMVGPNSRDTKAVTLTVK
ncbi:MAG: beta-glucosidase BglX [Bacteroidales bacterium]|nr:beta-glucosidase BglX [Bacteroidales bacterium]